MPTQREKLALELEPLTGKTRLECSVEKVSQKNQIDEIKERTETTGIENLDATEESPRDEDLSIIPRFRHQLRVRSQKIKEHGLRWKAEGGQRLQSSGQKLKEQGQRLRGRGGTGLRRQTASKMDSEFDLRASCDGGTPGSRRPTVGSRTDIPVSRSGTDPHSLIGRDGKKKSDMTISLDHDDGKYTAGDTIRGRVSITLTQDVAVKDLVLLLFGDGRVSWDETRTYFKGSSSRVLMKNREVILDHSVNLLKKEQTTKRTTSSRRPSATPAGLDMEDGLFLPTGIHNFPFEFVLPRDLPPTYSSKWGQVKYVAKAILHRPWKFDIEREKVLNIQSMVDLNNEPELARPIGGLGEFSPGLMCFRTGPVTVELRIARRGYVPGENMAFYVEIENNSRQKILSSRVAIMQQVTFKAGRKMKKLTTNTASLEKGEILPGTTMIWNNDSILVPQLPPSSNRTYKNIQLKYTVSLSVNYSSWADEFSLPVTVVLGTVGLRKQTINTYLSMLGYGATPRGSPSTPRRPSNCNTNGHSESNHGLVLPRQSVSTLSAFPRRSSDISVHGTPTVHSLPISDEVFSTGSDTKNKDQTAHFRSNSGSVKLANLRSTSKSTDSEDAIKEEREDTQRETSAM